MKKFLPYLLLLFPIIAFADAAPVVAAPDALTAWIGSVGALIAGFGGMAWYAKVSAIIMLVIGTSKLSFVENIFWNKLSPTLQTLLPAILGFLAGAVLVQPFNFGAMIAYGSAGLGANFIYELLDMAKIPAASNAMVMMVINIIQSALKRPAPPAPPAA